jgi:hypothetical protein
MPGPIESKYPGTPVMLFLAGLLVVILVKSVSSAYKVWRDVSPVVKKPSAKNNWEAHALVAIVALFLLLYFLAAIWIHSTIQ